MKTPHFAALALLTLSSIASADMIIDTYPSASTTASSFGQSSTHTFGQTITVTPGNTFLQSFAFDLNDSTGGAFGPVRFAAYVMAWDGTKATGTSLYNSGLRQTTGQPGNERFTFNTNSLSLTAGNQYVLFLSVDGYTDGVMDTSSMPLTPGDAYPGGVFVFTNNAPTSSGWGNFAPQDAGFQASFTTNALTSPGTASGVVPEPINLALGVFSIGLVGMARFRRQATVEEAH